MDANSIPAPLPSTLHSRQPCTEEEGRGAGIEFEMNVQNQKKISNVILLTKDFFAVCKLAKTYLK